MSRLKSIPKAKYWDYFILMARFLLGWTFLRYGYSKLTSGQFGISPEELSMSIEDLGLFKISWYLFDHQPFKAFIGISQIVCGLLLIINRTAILGAFLFLPIVTTILLIDLSFMPTGLAYAFSWRLGTYIIFDLLILWHYKEKMKTIWTAAWHNVNTKFKFPWWAYLMLPVMAILLEVIKSIPKMVFGLITNFTATVNSFGRIPELIMETIGKLI